MTADIAEFRAATSESDAISTLERLFAAQKSAAADRAPVSIDTRVERLRALRAALGRREADLVAAVSADFGHRPKIETQIADISMTFSAIRENLRHLRGWMRARRVSTPLHLWPATARLHPEPLGVVGIIAPWNYPINLALGPAATALAAGNRVILKPSELTPQTSALLADLISDAFDETVCAVVQGDADLGAAFAATPFDHLFFTGSTAVGRKVAEAAARNLTPTTLELGGKSPAIIDDSADLDRAAISIVKGKMFNAGQTCIAPDYVLTSRSRLHETVVAIRSAANALYPKIDTTGDLAAIVSQRHAQRLSKMVEDARDSGIECIEIGDRAALAERGKLPLTVLVDAPADCAAMKDEIFGPVLPILAVDDPAQAIAHINAGDKPLALYWFGRDHTARDEMIARTSSGAVLSNDTLLHFAHHGLPFGGVGASGWGAYHGEAGFRTFSHMKPVMHQRRPNGAHLLRPPYRRMAKLLAAIMRRMG